VLTLAALTLLPLADADGPKKAEAVPELNRKVLEFAEAHKGKQVGDGQCWILVAKALDHAGAHRPDIYVFGRRLGAREKLLPGDVIQFEEARFEGKAGIFSMPHHSSIVAQVHGPSRVTLIHQNFGAEGMKVSLTTIDLAERKQGSVTIYRPQPKAPRK
jgi:hypothetical protein